VLCAAGQGWQSKAEPVHPSPGQVHTEGENLCAFKSGTSSRDRGQRWGCPYPSSSGHKEPNF